MVCIGCIHMECDTIHIYICTKIKENKISNNNNYKKSAIQRIFFCL